MDTSTETVIASKNILKTKIEELIDVGYDLANNLEDVLMRGGEPTKGDKESYAFFLKVFRSIFKRTYLFVDEKNEGVINLTQLFDAHVQPKADYLLEAFYAYMKLLKGVGLYPKIIKKEEWE